MNHVVTALISSQGNVIAQNETDAENAGAIGGRGHTIGIGHVSAAGNGFATFAELGASTSSTVALTVDPDAGLLSWDGEAWAVHSYGVGATGYDLFVTRILEDGTLVTPTIKYGVSAEVYGGGGDLGHQSVTDALSGRTFTFQATAGPPEVSGHDRAGNALPGLPKKLAPPPGLAMWPDTYGSAQDVSPGAFWACWASDYLATGVLAQRFDLDGHEQGPLIKIVFPDGLGDGRKQVLALDDGTALAVTWTGKHLYQFRLKDDQATLETTYITQVATPTDVIDAPVLKMVNGEVWLLVGMWNAPLKTQTGRLMKLKPGCTYPSGEDL